MEHDSTVHQEKPPALARDNFRKLAIIFDITYIIEYSFATNLIINKFEVTTLSQIASSNLLAIWLGFTSSYHTIWNQSQILLFKYHAGVAQMMRKIARSRQKKWGTIQYERLTHCHFGVSEQGLLRRSSYSALLTEGHISKVVYGLYGWKLTVFLVSTNAKVCWKP